jgi:hypothetical protein
MDVIAQIPQNKVFDGCGATYVIVICPREEEVFKKKEGGQFGLIDLNSLSCQGGVLGQNAWFH